MAKMCTTDLSHERDSSGNVFICRNPKAFEVIVEFLRTGKLFHEEIGVSLAQLEVEADFFGLVGLIEMIKQNKSPKDDGTRELIFVLTSQGSLSGPILRLNLKPDGLKWSQMFIGLREIKNAMRATFPAVFDRSSTTNLLVRRASSEPNDWQDKTIVTFGGDMSRRIKVKKSVWFCVRDSEYENVLPPSIDLMNMESKILSNWDHYWKSAEDCRKTKSIRMEVLNQRQVSEDLEAAMNNIR